MVQRLLDFNVEPLVLQNCLRVISYQQLLPTLTDECGVLFDIIENPLILKQSQNYTNNWLTLLRQAYEDGQITEETYQTASSSCPTSIFF